ncbi:hypothetical protein H5A44_04060 [Pectobacterium brasiliense]|uniref:DUF6387 family protein n=1 Tax=Pectobacterium brasiliense TaxID=180957 RepID=UPI001969C700|nr:DUF6387 family protein [Pectobacterium brasiliense]MBN3341605.1 hypothetical protein [Pectobacterium brasiliense]
MTKKMPKAEIVEELSKWFDISRYDVLKNLTLEQIYAELERRIFAYKARQQWETAGEENQMLAIYHDAQIRSGKVIHETKWVSDSHMLAHSYAVRPMTRTSLFNYGRAMYRLENNVPKDDVSVSSEYISEYLKQGGLNPANKMLIEIDLDEASSDDLAEHLKVLITQWQKHLKAPKPPEKDFRFGHKTFQKILDYKIIPLMDLIGWEQLNNQKIPYPVLAGILHTDMRYARGSEQIKDTDYPLAYDFLNNDNYFKSLNDFFIKNMHVKSSDILAVIGMNDKPEDKKKTRDVR